MNGVPLAAQIMFAICLVAAMAIVALAINQAMKESAPPQHPRDARGRFARRRKAK